MRTLPETPTMSGQEQNADESATFLDTGIVAAPTSLFLSPAAPSPDATMTLPLNAMLPAVHHGSHLGGHHFVAERTASQADAQVNHAHANGMQQEQNHGYTAEKLDRCEPLDGGFDPDRNSTNTFVHTDVYAGANVHDPSIAINDQLYVGAQANASSADAPARAQGSPTSKRKRQVLSIDRQLRVLAMLKSGRSLREVHRLTGVPRSTIQNIKSRETSIYAAAATGAQDARKSYRIARCRFPEIEEAVISFVHWLRIQRVPITGKLIRTFAIHEAKSLGAAAFQASNGWIEGLLRRNQIEVETDPKRRQEVSGSEHDVIQRFMAVREKLALTKNSAMSIQQACEAVVRTYRIVSRLTDSEELLVPLAEARDVANRLLAMQTVHDRADDGILDAAYALAP